MLASVLLCVLVVLLSFTLVHVAPVAGVVVEPLRPQVSINFDPSDYPRGNFELPFEDPLIADTRTDKMQPEQIRVTYYGDEHVLISWSTEEAQLVDSFRGEQAQPPRHNLSEGSWVKWGWHSGEMTRVVRGISYVYSYPNETSVSYVSGVQHHVLLSEILPGRTCYYVVGDSEGHWSEQRSFQTVGASKSMWPFRLGVLADTGVTFNSSATFRSMAKVAPDMLMLVGDMSYADLNTDHFPEGYTKQQAWDFFMRLLSRTLPHTVVMHTNGNHEVEPQKKHGKDVLFEAYNARMPVPQRFYEDDISVRPVTQETASANMYYSVNVAGAHFVFLSSYIPGDDFSPNSEQYKWLKRDLSSVHRERTPWIIVSFHAPIYNSYYSHFKENECFRTHYEELFSAYNVDITFHGHVHAYERTFPMNAYEAEDDGRISITVGDGGNIEGVAVLEDGSYYRTFIDQFYEEEPFCRNPEGRKAVPYQPQGPCISVQPRDGGYCFSQQPEWSAFREASWGFGVLTIVNDTVATWAWHRVTSDDSDEFLVGDPFVADEITILRGQAATIKLDERKQQLQQKQDPRAEAEATVESRDVNVAVIDAATVDSTAEEESAETTLPDYKGAIQEMVEVVDRVEVMNRGEGAALELDERYHHGSLDLGRTGGIHSAYRHEGVAVTGSLAPEEHAHAAAGVVQEHQAVQVEEPTVIGEEMPQDAWSEKRWLKGSAGGAAGGGAAGGGAAVGVGGGAFVGRSGGSNDNNNTASITAEHGWHARLVGYMLIVVAFFAIKFGA